MINSSSFFLRQCESSYWSDCLVVLLLLATNFQKSSHTRLIRGCFSFSQCLRAGVFSSLSPPPPRSLWLASSPPLFGKYQHGAFASKLRAQRKRLHCFLINSIHNLSLSSTGTSSVSRFCHLFDPEKTLDITIIQSVLKYVPRWQVSGKRSIVYFPKKWYPILDPNSLISMPYSRLNCLLNSSTEMGVGRGVWEASGTKDCSWGQCVMHNLDNYESGVHPGNVTLLISGTYHTYHILTIGEGWVGSRKTLVTIYNNDSNTQT